eukprot:510104_1
MDVAKSRAKQFDIVLEGWLHRKSKHINRWSRKWIILSSQSIYTYKSKETKSNASEILHLSDIQSIKKDNTNHVFVLIDRNNSIFQFQCEHPLHTKQWILAITAYIKRIQIPIHVDCRRNVDYCCQFSLGIPYRTAYKYTLNNLLRTIINHMQRKHQSIQFEPLQVLADSFIGTHIEYKTYDWTHFDITITDYDKGSVIQQGVHVLIDISLYHHDLTSDYISCVHMHRNRHHMCSIYSKMKCGTLFTKKALHHVQNYTHYHNEYTDKEPCKLDPCPAYQRVIHGGNVMNDLCHVSVYKHPPRSKRIQSTQNLKCFVLNANESTPLNAVYTPTIEDMIECVYNEQDGYMKTFIAEIIRNGCKKHLYLSNDDRFQNKDKYTIMNTVQDKLVCMRHKQMGSPLNRSEMLALILYTSTDCNERLCNAQRDGDYDKWKWFDYCLYNAVLKLSQRECGSYAIYTALKDVKLQYEFIERGCLKTYLSTTWVEDIALQFMEMDAYDKYILFEMDGEFREKCIGCDVSWISKFGSNECEVLIARSIDNAHNCFECVVSNEFHLYLPQKIQTVRVLPMGATVERAKEIMKYPLMDLESHDEDTDDHILHVNTLQHIDGVTEDIICGYLRMLVQQLPIPQRYQYYTVPVLIRASIALYYFNISQPSTYLYPQYVSAHNLNTMLQFESERVTKYANIAFHKDTKQLVIGTTTPQDGHCMFLYSLDVADGDEIILKSSKTHTTAITAVQFCEDGSYFVSYSAQASSLMVWDITSEEQQCIKECLIESCDKTYSLSLYLMHTKLTWSTDGVTLELPDKKPLHFRQLKTSKTHKCLIFIVEGMHKLRKTIFKQNTGDGVTDLPITSNGIDDAFNLSRYLHTHSPIIRREEESTDYAKESVETPIQDALNLLKTDILSPDNRNVLQTLSLDLLSTCEELEKILEDAKVKIQAFKAETSADSTTFGPTIDRKRTLIVSDYYKDLEEEDEKILNALESTLKLEWVLDELISSEHNSIVVSANERRAISTTMIALWDRFERDKNEFVYLIPYLQQLEDQFVSETPTVTLSNFEKHCTKYDVNRLTAFYETRLVMEPSLQEMIRRHTLEEDQDRFELFCDWIFEIMNDTVIICSHTDWFLAFMNLYLLECANFSVAKTVPNCSVVGFRMTRHVIPDGSTKYQIMEGSITNVYRGFK